MDYAVQRLSSQLGAHGFVEALGNDHKRRVGEFIVYRQSHVPGVFQQVGIKAVMAGDVAWAWAGCAVVPGFTAVKGLVEDEVLLGVVPGEESGRAPIRTSGDAAAWVSALTPRALATVEKITTTRAGGLIERTAAACAATAGYLDRLDLSGPRTELLARLKAAMSPEQLTMQSQWVNLGLPALPSIGQAYEIAASAMVLYHPDVEPSGWRARTFESWIEGVADREGAWRLQILASRIAGEPAWAPIGKR